MRNSWIEQLSKTLTTSRRIAFIGVGQELRGDDAAGILAVRLLQQASESAVSNEKAQASAPFLFEAGSLPEASAGPLRRFGPEWVIFLDAADLGAPPGTVRWIQPDEIGGFTGSTHTFPMGGFARYLESELGCRVAVLGIQPKQLEFDSPASEEVRRAIEEIVAGIVGLVKP